MEYSYTRSLIQELYILAHENIQIRKGIFDIQEKLFGNGLIWDTSDNDPEQNQLIKDFQSWSVSSNISGVSLIGVLKDLEWDLNVCDHAYLEVFRKKSESKLIQIRRLHPALVELDLNKKSGLPGETHFLCSACEDENIYTAPERCQSCETELVPSYYKYYHRGRYIYFGKDGIIELSNQLPYNRMLFFLIPDRPDHSGKEFDGIMVGDNKTKPFMIDQIIKDDRKAINEIILKRLSEEFGVWNNKIFIPDSNLVHKDKIKTF